VPIRSEPHSRRTTGGSGWAMAAGASAVVGVDEVVVVEELMSTGAGRTSRSRR